MTHDALAMTEYSNRPTVLVLSDSDAGFADARRDAELAGCRVSDCVGIEGAVERLDRQVSMSAALAYVERDHGPDLDHLLDQLNAAARAGRYRSVVAAPPSLIDAISARTPHTGIFHLCEPSEVDRVLAIRLACAGNQPRLHDIGKGDSAPRLQQLSEEVSRIASILASLSEGAMPSVPPPPRDAMGNEIDACTIRSIIRARRLRDQYFPDNLFADPAWDMLLDLMAARLDGKRVAVSSLCIAAAVPATTALRWIKTMTDQGLFVRVADPQDGRRVFIQLSDEAASQLGAYLKAAKAITPLAI